MSRPMIAFHTKKVQLTNDEARTILEEGPEFFALLELSKEAEEFLKLPKVPGGAGEMVELKQKAPKAAPPKDPSSACYPCIHCGKSLDGAISCRLLGLVTENFGKACVNYEERAKPTPHIPQTVFPPMRKDEEALIRLRVLRSRLANLKMNGKTGILQEVDAILGVLE